MKLQCQKLISEACVPNTASNCRFHSQENEQISTIKCSFNSRMPHTKQCTMPCCLTQMTFSKLRFYKRFIYLFIYLYFICVSCQQLRLSTAQNVMIMNKQHLFYYYFSTACFGRSSLDHHQVEDTST